MRLDIQFCINILSGDQNRWWSTCLCDICAQTERWSILRVLYNFSTSDMVCIYLYIYMPQQDHSVNNDYIHSIFSMASSETHSHPHTLTILSICSLFCVTGLFDVFCSTPKDSFSLTRPSCSHKYSFVMTITNHVTFLYKCYSFSVLEKLL